MALWYSGAKLFSAADSLENTHRPDNPITAGLMRKIVPEGLYYEIMTWMPLDSNAIFLTWDLAGTLVCFQGVAILAVAAEWASLVKAVLATNSGRTALVNIITGFRVIAQLITHGARALGPKRPLNTTVCAASIVVRAALLVWIQKDRNCLEPSMCKRNKKSKKISWKPQAQFYYYQLSFNGSLKMINNTPLNISFSIFVDLSHN